MTKTEPNIVITQMDDHRHLPSNSRLTARNIGVPPTKMKAAVFLDRDGVLNEDVNYLTDTQALRILPGVAQAINSIQDRYYVIVATNQSAIARDMLDEDGLLDIHRELAQQLNFQRAVVDAFYYCPHLPDAPNEAYRIACSCRKPLPGMLLNASNDWDIPLERSFLIGDNHRDVEAGIAAGVRSILITSETPISHSSAMTAADLAGAAQTILEIESPTTSVADPPGDIR